MQYEYPCEIVQDEGGFWLVTFPDVPEAGTDDRDRGTALREAADALIAALAGCVLAGRPVPVPSPVAGRAMVPLPPLVAAKLALADAKVRLELSDRDFGRRLGLSEAAVGPLLDLDADSRLDEVLAALERVGRRAVLEFETVVAA